MRSDVERWEVTGRVRVQSKLSALQLWNQLTKQSADMWWQAALFSHVQRLQPMGESRKVGPTKSEPVRSMQA